jgi:hypothetical protein
MARFRKSVKIAPGVKLNLSKSGVSGTFGVKGASVNVGKDGAYLNTGIPGTGVYDRKKLGGGSAAQGADESGEDSGLFVENPTPEQLAARDKVFGIIALILGGISLAFMLWLGFNIIGIIFMGLCFLIGLGALAPKAAKTNQKSHE